MEELDANWIEDFEETDKPYALFYKGDLSEINLFFLYVDRDYELFHVKKKTHVLEDNVLKKEYLINILKNNMNHNNKKYRPISLLKYNITLETNNIVDFTNNPTKYNFLSSEDSIKDFKWENTIKSFNDLNSLHVIFFETWKNNKKSLTKKIYIRSKKGHKKTKRNHLKIKA